MLPVFHMFLGGVLVVSGAILTPTPVPFGLIMLTIGLALLAPYMPPVQALIRAIRRKWPKVDMNLKKHRDRFPPVIRTTIDKTNPEIAPAG
ncbi:MAG: hypothetical protein AAB227_00200 [Pseudomonadota bacterium]